MKFRIWKVILLPVLALVLALMSACSNSSTNSEATTKPDPQSTNSPSAASPGSAKPADGPLGKYDPPIEVTTVRDVNAGLKFRSGDSYDSNIWTKEFESQLGIKLTNKWKVSTEQYNNKITVSMVSGNLPDFFMVNDQQFQTLSEAGQLADLTEVYKKYASDLTKQSLDSDGGVSLQAGTYGGKLLGIPSGGGGRDDGQMIWIRNDWLKNLKLDPPKTMDDVLNIAKAFANNDPDQNQKKDTWGLSLDYNLFNGWSGLDGFFNGYGAYPYNPAKGSATNLIFLKGKDGKPIWADTQPEVKTALGKLQELFKAGAINPEFSVIDGNKSAELATQGKVGMVFGEYWVANWPLNNMKKDNPNVDWKPYSLVSADGKPANAQAVKIRPAKFWVVNKNAKNPEAVFKLLNYFMEKRYGKTADPSYHIVTENDVTYNVWSYAPINAGFVETNQNDFDAVKEALASGNSSKLSTAAQKYFADTKAYQAGDAAKWSTQGLLDAYGILGQYKKDNRYVVSRYLGAPTPTMIAKGPTLRDEEIKTFTTIIMGAKPLDYFDEWVQNWRKQGGDAILQEVADSGYFQ